MADGGVLRLSKHHGAGNDFLVMLDPDDRRPLSGAEVRALCDRQRGIGADGLVRACAGPAGHGLGMDLRNSDGSEAEMSGNGIRCLVQAAVDAGWMVPGDVDVYTTAGLRTVRYQPGAGPGQGYASVAMGRAVLGAELRITDPPGLRAARRVDMGNPHVVLLGGPFDPEVVSTVGPRVDRSVPGGANVEFAWQGPGDDELTLRVWERGVGPTLACGTGTCAVAAAAHDWGVVGERVRVHNPGGPLDVTIKDGGIELAGPTQRVAELEMDESVLGSLVDAWATATAAAKTEVAARP